MYVPKNVPLTAFIGPIYKKSFSKGIIIVYRNFLIIQVKFNEAINVTKNCVYEKTF